MIAESLSRRANLEVNANSSVGMSLLDDFRQGYLNDARFSEVISTLLKKRYLGIKDISTGNI